MVVLSLLLACCRPLPEYALPTIESLSNRSAADEPVVISYRMLTRADYQASGMQLPPALRSHREQLNAHTQVQIRPLFGGYISVVETRQQSRTVFHCSAENVRFQAVMIPAASWWNPAVPATRAAYVLEHEQIHFALAEIAARQFNRFVAKDADRLIATGTDAVTCRQQATALVNQQMQRIVTRSHDRQLHFDQDLSGRYDPVGQRWWRDAVQAELAVYLSDVSALRKSSTP